MFDGARHHALDAEPRVRDGLVLVPEGRRIVMTLTVHENLLMGAFNRARPQRGRRRDRRHLRPLSESRGAPPPACLGAVGRRAADAGDRTRPAGGSQADDAGRAIARPEPASHQRGVRAYRRAQPRAAASPSCWSSRIPTGRWSSPTGPMCSSLAGCVMDGPPERLLADHSLLDAYLGQATATTARRDDNSE